MNRLLPIILFIAPLCIAWTFRYLPFPLSGLLALSIGFAAVVLLAFLHSKHHKELPVSSLLEYSALGTLLAMVALAIL